MEDADKLAMAQRREQAAKDTLADITEMDDIMSGTIPESQLMQTQTQDPEQNQDIIPEEPEEPEDTENGVQDNIVASAEPQTTEAEAKAESKPEVSTVEGYDLTEFINNMAKSALGQVAPVVPQAPAPAPVVPAPQVQSPTVASNDIQLTDLITEAEMEEAFQSPAKMIEVITNVALKAASAGAQSALLRLPQVVKPVIAQEAELRQQAQKFWEDNKELVPYKGYVRYCATQVENTHPEYTPAQVFAETAALAKASLPLVKEAAQRAKRAPTKPAFVDQQGQRGKNTPSAGKLSALEKELSDMPDTF
jgi:hypothetical protein